MHVSRLAAVRRHDRRCLDVIPPQVTKEAVIAVADTQPRCATWAWDGVVVAFTPVVLGGSGAWQQIAVFSVFTVSALDFAMYDGRL